MGFEGCAGVCQARKTEWNWHRDKDKLYCIQRQVARRVRDGVKERGLRA